VSYTVDFSRIEAALSTTRGWIEFALVLACIAIAFVVDRRIERAREARRAATGAPGLHGGVVRVIFPVVALLLLGILRVALQDWPPFFVKIALPAFYALLAIRLLVYGLRRMFPNSRWLPSSERAIAFTIWAAVVLYFVGVLPEIESILDEVHLPLGKHQTSLLTIGKGLAVIAMTLVATLWVSGLLEQRLLALPTADMSMRVVLGKAVRAVMIVVGVLIALQAIGFDLTLLSVFGGALGVGIGLGLQKLASNYIAGFTILLDRSIRLGDMITVDNRFGVVTKVTARYVVVRSLDGIEAVVPNETLVTTTVLNHSYSSRETRIGVPVQVAYGADLELALQLMVEAARGEARVLKEPNPPAAFVVRFADSGIDLELGFWINDPENGQGNIRSAINLAIWRAFRANAISIPFPQREVRIIGGPAPAPAGPAGPDALAAAAGGSGGTPVAGPAAPPAG
jgi:small-conductance mechanosensitive channel